MEAHHGWQLVLHLGEGPVALEAYVGTVVGQGYLLEVLAEGIGTFGISG